MKDLRVGRTDLDWAAQQGLIEPEQVEPLWKGLQSRAVAQPEPSRFDVQHLLWYGGAMLVLIAMGWVGAQVWDMFSGAGIIAVSLAYGVTFAAAGKMLGDRPGLQVPGGLLVTLAVSMVPLAVFGIEHQLGWFGPLADGQRDLPFLRNFCMEAATIAAAVVALRAVRFPFLTAPLSLAAWFMVLDLSRFFTGVEGGGFQFQQWLTVGFGLAMIVASLVVDRKTREDYAFWGLFFGATAFWGALSVLAFDFSEVGLLAYAGVNLAMMLVSVVLSRRIFVVYGALGLVGYLGHLTFSVFADSMLFPFALTFLGVGTIAAGVVYHKTSARIEAFVRSLVPGWLADALPAPRS